MTYRLGIDAGSKTIKLVLLDEDGKTVFSQYSLHKSDIRTTMAKMLHDTVWRFGDAEVSVCVTGSAGMRLADVLEVQFAQEVIASKYALGQLYPQADVAIELGGEDAKIIFLTDGVEQRMNGSCAGGTGGFIDLMCGTLGVQARELNSLALGYSTVYPIASRCAVFAQTDVRPLLNEGARKSDIAASILQAVVTQTIAGLSCGRPIRGNVVFLGGPLQVYPELVSRFRRTLGLSHAQTIKPPDAHLFVAMGAAMLGGSSGKATLLLSELEQRLAAAPAQEAGGIERLQPLFSSDGELAEFRQRHAQSMVSRRQLMSYSGEVYIGIDAGSTTCKLVMIGSDGELLYSDYEKSHGNVINTIRVMLEELYSSLPREYDGGWLVAIKHVKVTGYGEQLLRVAFGADSGEVETIAHLRAARELEPDVDFVLDIGGQDIKCLRIKDGAIDDVLLNEACSSGCGALIEGFSRSLGFSQWSFSDVALTSESPVDLGTRCTVFMTSRVRHAQKEGIPAADIAAGLAYSVVRNALYKVIGCTNADQLGKHMVVQGGTFMSDAVLRAFELECGREVVRPSIANLMGAYGAALLARDEVLASEQAGTAATAAAEAASTLLGPCELARLQQQQSTRRCQGCANNCLLTISSFYDSSDQEPIDRVFITGNRCEFGMTGREPDLGPINLFAYERKLLSAYDGGPDAETDSASSGPIIGIPRVLDLYESYPFWQTFFTRLGFTVKSIPASTTGVYRSGAQAVMSEAVCYPAKLAHGHVAQLIEQGVDLIFVPTGGSSCSSASGTGCVGMTGESDERCGVPAKAPELIACPVSSSYARLIADDVAELSGGAVDFISFDLSHISSDSSMAMRITAALDALDLSASFNLPIDIDSVEAALDAAAAEQDAFYRRLQLKADEALQQLCDQGAHGIVLAGHPYHVDAGLSHSIDELIASLGFTVFSTTSIAHLAAAADDTDYRHLVAGNWVQPRALYQAAQTVIRHPELDLVQLYSFGCGVDALSTTQLRKLLEDAGRIYTALKVDEMVDTAAIRIRLRSLAAALKERGKPTLTTSPASGIGTLDTRNSEAPVVLVPALAPEHLAAIEPLLQQQGIHLQMIGPLDQQDVETGLRYCSNDLCHPMIAMAGQIIAWAKQSSLESDVTVLVPQVCGGCRSIELETIVRQELARGGFGQRIEVIGFPGKDSQISLSPQLAAAIYEVLDQVDVSASEPKTSVSSASGVSTSEMCSAGIDRTITRPKIGVLGNAGLLFTPFLNKDVLRRIEDEGCQPVLPSITDLLLTNAPLEKQIGQMVEQGALDIIYVQSFGCMTGHIHARGALKRIKRRFPQINITFIDYDSGASEINQINRLKLALTLAHERCIGSMAEKN